MNATDVRKRRIFIGVLAAIAVAVNARQEFNPNRIPIAVRQQSTATIEPADTHQSTAGSLSPATVIQIPTPSQQSGPIVSQPVLSLSPSESQPTAMSRQKTASEIRESPQAYHPNYTPRSVPRKSTLETVTSHTIDPFFKAVFFPAKILLHPVIQSGNTSRLGPPPRTHGSGHDYKYQSRHTSGSASPSSQSANQQQPPANQK
jgi:hypothetical protein